jgi:hypothetical protein
MAATFNCSWINRLDQFGFVNIDVVVTNDSGIIPEARFSKNWMMQESDCNATFLESESADLVERIIDEWNTLNPDEAV